MTFRRHFNGIGENIPRGFFFWLVALVGTCFSANLPAASPAADPPPAVNAAEPESPGSPRQLYNLGSDRLRAGKLTEAEALLQNAVASQNEKMQSPALYNLGCTRFKAGVEEFKKGPSSKAIAAVSESARENGDHALRAIDHALESDDLDAMVAAYLRGRGARKELKAATEAVKRAVEKYGTVLGKWRRASGDFKSARELSPNDDDAQSNADAVDRSIAKLVDLQQMMLMGMDGMMKQRSDLLKKMGELKKKMPGNAGDQFKGKGGEDDDDDDGQKPPPEPKEGMEEGANKSGQERMMSPEEAARLLGMLKLDANRKLPLGVKDTGKPAGKKGRDW